MKMEMSEKWADTDQYVHMVFNYTEKREAVNITTHYKGATGVQIEAKDLTTISGTYNTGDYHLWNGENDPKEFEIIVTGNNADGKN
jgi:hypothetical protein